MSFLHSTLIYHSVLKFKCFEGLYSSKFCCFLFYLAFLLNKKIYVVYIGNNNETSTFKPLLKLISIDFSYVFNIPELIKHYLLMQTYIDNGSTVTKASSAQRGEKEECSLRSDPPLEVGFQCRYDDGCTGLARWAIGGIYGFITEIIHMLKCINSNLS